MSKISCIYTITNIATGQIYVGQTVNYARRQYQHFYRLQRNSSENAHLQNAFNKYGLDQFVMEILELCEPCDLNYLEIYWIEKLNTSNKLKGYNKKSGGSGLGAMTEDAIERNRQAQLGKKLSEERKAKVRSLSRDQMEEIKLKRRLGLTYNQIANIYNVSYRTIWRVVNNTYFFRHENNDYIKKTKTVVYSEEV